MSRQPTVDIIISNWNSGPLLRECLESIVTADKTGIQLLRVVVLDNASNDGSCHGLESLALPLTLTRNRENRGYGANINRGAAGSSADYLLFLNADTRLFNDSLPAPVRFMEQPDNARVGFCGIQLVDESGRVSRSSTRFPTPRHFLTKTLGLDLIFPTIFPSHFMTEWDHQETRDLDHVMGAFVVVRRRCFEELGGFDERFFVYLEDVDLSLRARQQGWRTVYLAEARAYHKGGGSLRRVPATSLFYALRSRIQYSYKHFGWSAATAVLLATVLIEPFTRLVWAARRRSLSDATGTVFAMARLGASLPRILSPHRRAPRFPRSGQPRQGIAQFGADQVMRPEGKRRGSQGVTRDEGAHAVASHPYDE